MAKIVVLYDPSDAASATQVVASLDQVFKNHEIWFQGKLIGGQNPATALHQQIDQADVVCLLVGSAFFNNKDCVKAYRYALKQGKPIVPVHLVSQLKIPRDLSQLLPVSLVGGITDVAHLNQLYGSLHAIIDKPSASSVATAATTPPTSTGSSKVRNRRCGKISLEVLIGILGLVLAVLSFQPGAIGYEFLCDIDVISRDCSNDDISPTTQSPVPTSEVVSTENPESIIDLACTSDSLIYALGDALGTRVFVKTADSDENAMEVEFADSELAELQTLPGGSSYLFTSPQNEVQQLFEAPLFSDTFAPVPRNLTIEPTSQVLDIDIVNGHGAALIVSAQGVYSIVLFDIIGRDSRFADSSVFQLPNQIYNVQHIAVSPDGRDIAFAATSNVESANHDIYRVNANGTQLFNVTNQFADDIRPVWWINPEDHSSNIVFSSRATGDYDLYVINRAGTQISPLITLPGSNEVVSAISTANDQIAFVSVGNTRTVLVSRFASIGDLTEVLQSDSDVVAIDWCP